MPVHKKVAKAIKKVGKKALKRVGVRLSKVLPRTKGQRRKKHLGPPRVGMRSVKGRKGKIITIKKPRPRST